MAYSYKGAISFGLVYIPITLTTAIKENDIGFNTLEKNTMSRVKYKKTCVECDGREISGDEIVKGYQYEKDKYAIFTDEDFEKLKTQKDKSITITQFVDINQVDPIYFERSYYVNPTGGEQAFALLLAAMEKENRAALSKTVLGTRETLVLIHANKGKLIANTLYFHDEVKKAPLYESIQIKKEELDLAKSLIDNMTKPFKPEEFKDEYNERLKKAIKQKIAGKEISIPKEEKATNIINIMDALKKSVEMTNAKNTTNVTKRNGKAI